MSKNISLDQLTEILDGKGYFGLRGLSGVYGKTEYQDGEILECSIDDWDSRGVEYNPELDRLSGTSAIGVNEYMNDSEIMKMYQKALNYSDCGKVILINGDVETAGCDEHETIISYKGDGAKFLGCIEF
ncbi:MAG: hypothetical protein WC365_08435 [Candidatus Babeliales bacterium]